MQKQKSTKLKDPQTNILSSVLAQFDIQTQVNRMVSKTFDSLMRTNKQAFDFIKQSEHKFITFEQRLSKAQTYYKNIQMNINSKIQLTDNMNKRLQQFAAQFWNSMKQNNNQIISMNKRFEQLSLQKKNIQNSQKQSQKHIKRLQANFMNLNDKINEQTTKTLQLIKQNQLKTQEKMFQQRNQIRQLTNSLIQSKSLLQSKSQILTDLLQDLQVYKNDRPLIMNQIQKIFEELSYRSLKVDVIEMRGYIDSKMVKEVERTNNLCMRLDTQIKLEERDRKRQDQKVVQMITQIRNQFESQIKVLQDSINNQINQINNNISTSEQKTQLQLSNFNISLSSLSSKYDKQIPELFHKSLQTKQLVDETKSSLSSISYQIKQLYNSIQQSNKSIQQSNKLVQAITKQNNQRKQQMTSMKASTQNQGNITQQVLKLFQKTDLLSEQIKNIQNQAFIRTNNIFQSIQKNKNQFESNKKQTCEVLININQEIEKINLKTTNQLSSIDNTFKKLVTQISVQLTQKMQFLQRQNKSYINQKIVSIKDKLDELAQIHKEIKQFKQAFKRQIQQNQKVNISVAQKMERVMSLFTKLKSDNTVKFQQLTSDLQRRAIQLKASLADLQEIKKYISVSNQCINLLLAHNIFGSSPSNNQGNNHLNNSTLHLPTQHKDASNSQDHNLKPIKISSILQGWVLQSDQNHDKTKYRGQNFTFSNRIKLFQIFLEFFVKHTQKIKGTIIENGRDVFMKILESNQDVFQQRKRVTSKRKPSELPKLYI